MKVPKKLKYRKYFLLRYKSKNQFSLNKNKMIGNVGLINYDQKKIDIEQVEACRIAIRRCIKKKEMYIGNRLYPYCGVSKKSVGMRMGKGKGSLSKGQIPLSKGQILYEIKFKIERDGLNYFKLFKVFSKAGRKLSVKTKVLFYLF